VSAINTEHHFNGFRITNVSLPFKLAMAMAAVVLCWAYSPIGIHIGLESYSPGHLALLRFLIASLFMALIALFIGIGVPRLRDVPWLMLLGLFAVALHHMALNMGQRWVSPGASSVLAQTAPLFSTFIAAVCLKERVSGWRWLWVAVGLLGVVVVIWGDKGVGEFHPQGLVLHAVALRVLARADGRGAQGAGPGECGGVDPRAVSQCVGVPVMGLCTESHPSQPFGQRDVPDPARRHGAGGGCVGQ
jgi:drug/metabolite transporter (DMT)-like permease